MKRIQKDNINTVEYWDGIYKIGDNETDCDNDKFSMLSNFIQDGWSIADIGCGTGNFIYHVLKKRKNVSAVGYDISKEAIKKLLCDGEVCDIHSIPSPDEVYNFVSCFEVLEHVDDPQKVVDEIFRILKHEGICLITTPFRDHIPSGEHIWEFTLDDIFFMLMKFGRSWVIPFSSGRSSINDDLSIKYPRGNLDSIYALAIK
jgi:ubiquinone/menaquinone biosynthesis C-methylase UbiE